MRDSDREAVALALASVRERTLQLISGLSDDALARQHSPLMSPIAWDIGHIGAFEELWLVRRLGSVTGESELDEVYDAFRTPRAARGSLRLPDGGSLLDRLADVRQWALSLLPTVDFEADNPLLRDGFCYELVREHEAQHQETILQTIALMTSETYSPADRRERPAAGSARPGEMIRVPGIEFHMGAGAAGFAYDNERPRHDRRLLPFEIGRYPVTNGEYIEFMAAGGYRDRSLWSDRGWEWKREAGLLAPEYWVAHGDGGVESLEEAVRLSRETGLEGWRRRTAFGEERLHPFEPVAHICWHEAEACARFASARLPTEVEWEVAAAWDPDGGELRTCPWGDAPPSDDMANLDQLAFGVVPIGTCPAGRSGVGCEQLLGDVWEWTSTPFDGYPGFRAFPYPEYSEVFFGPDYRVLRGGSWATRREVARNTFRNWDFPIRRQIFCGLRLARDA